MPNPYFKFKQFSVFHDKCAMKVGVDGVLTGAWAMVENAVEILDIGTGSGLIALMLAQRSKAHITAIDINQQAVLQATENVQNSQWENRITVLNTSLQEFALNSTVQYDLIVSNPPFFVNSLKTPVESRTLARHTDTLTHEELIENALKLLTTTGRICLILPVKEGRKCIEFAGSNNLFCTKQVTVYPKPNAEAKRLLLEFGMIKYDTIIDNLLIESEIRHEYSPEFSELVREFYLKL